MNGKNQNTKRPSKWLFAAEPARALLELGVYFAGKPLLKRLPKGNGEAVLVLPGFMANDFSTRPLRAFLEKLGYKPYTWDLGMNLGKPSYIDKVVDRVKEISKENKRRKITIIGWSLGGIYAREAAKICPKKVSQIITLGSPFAGLNKPNSVSWLYKLVSGQKLEDLDKDLIARIKEPVPVPMTAIYSHNDGIVSWENCIEQEEGPFTQNIQVNGSHCGMIHNVFVLSCIANRLNQSRRHWKPFETSAWYERFLYPNLMTA